MAVIFYDDFNVAIDLWLVNTTPDVGTGWSYVFDNTANSWHRCWAATGDVGSDHDENSAGLAVASQPPPPTAEYTISVKMTGTEGSGESGTKPAGLFARWGDNNNYYTWQHLPNAHADNNQKIWLKSGGAFTLLASVDTAEAVGDAYKFEIRDGTKKLFLNGAEILSTNDNTLAAAGECGIFHGGFSGDGGHLRMDYRFDDYTVETIESAPPAVVDLQPITLTASAPASTIETVTPAAPVIVDLQPIALGISAPTASAIANIEPGAFGWRVLVDWDGDGEFSQPIDDISALCASANWRIGMLKPFQELADEAEAQITLINTDGRFNPENTAGPLYGKLKAGRRVQVQAIGSGAPAVMYTGWIESIESTWRQGSGAHTGKSRARLVCTGSKQQLQDTEITLPLFENVTGDAILAAVLGDLGIAAVLDTGKTPIAIYGDAGAIKAYNVINEITAAERGRFFHNRAGMSEWWNRHRLIGYTVPQATVDLAGDYRPFDFDYTFGRYVSNSVRVQAYQRTHQAASEALWQLESPVRIPPANIRELEVTLRKSNGQFAATGAVSVTGATFSAGSATITAAASGGTARITITNSGIVDAVLTGLAVEGAPITQQNALIAEVEDGASVAEYGRRGQRQIDLKALADYDQARQIALYELHRRALPFGAVESLTYRRAADGVDNAHLLSWGVGTRLQLDLAALGHNAGYFIVGERHMIEPGKHQAIYSLEPADGDRYWLLGVPGYSELGQTTLLGL